MSSLFNQASLVVEPAVYENGKVYATKPFDGSGDLTFSRASNATRVGPDGLIEKVRTNLLTYSQDFSNAVWVKSAGATLTHSQTDPNGGTTASRLQMPSGTSNFLAASAISGLTNGGKYTHSIYMKSNTGSTQSVRLLDGVRGVAGGSLTASVTTSWQRFEVVITTASTSAGIQIDNNAGTFANDILIAFAQTEESDFGATDYIATTSAAVSVGPVSGLPRLDYLNSSCPRLLLEPQRSNLVPFSESYDNAAWSSNGTVVENQGVSPSGYTDADLFYSTTGTGRRIFDAVTITSGSTYTSSVFAKASGKSFIYFPDVDNITNSVWFNLSNGTFSTPIEGTAAMVDYGNGWYRCSLTTTSTGTTGYSYVGISDASGSVSFTQNGTDGVLLWGSQLELGAYQTSYLPTLSTSVTRVADAASKTGISSLIGQTEGTLFVETTYNGAANTSNFNRIINITDGSLDNFIAISKNAGTAALYVYSQVAGAAQVDSTPIANTNLIGTHKIAFAYKANDFVLYVDGVQRFTDTSGLVAPCSQLNIGGIGALGGGTDQLGGSVNQALLFKTRLTNAQCQELTSL